MKEFVVLYILYPNLTNPTHVFYLRKDPKEKAPKRIWNKLVGIGGGVEPEDREGPEKIINATRREVLEELEITLNSKQTLVYSGKVLIKSQKRIVHFLKTAYDKKIEDRYVEDEGNIKYFSINYHKKNPKEFAEGDPEILDLLYFTDDFFDKTIN